MIRSHGLRDSLAAFDFAIEAWMAHSLERVRLEHGRRTLRVHFGLEFVALAALLGLRHGLGGSVLTLLVMSSVLLTQELPRALLARAFGRSSWIVISAVGGHTELGGEPLVGASAIAMSAAGSVANALFACAAFALSSVTHDGQTLLRALALSHAVWGGMQLLPVLPSRLGLAIAAGRRPRVRLAYAIASLIITVALSNVLVMKVDSVLVFACACLWVIACGRQASQVAREAADASAGIDAAIADASARLETDDSTGAVGILRWGLGIARSRHRRWQLARLLAHAAIARDDRALLLAALQMLHADEIDLELLASALVCWDRDDEALLLLERARALGQRGRATTKLLIDLQLRRGEPEAALEIAHADAALLSDSERVAATTTLAALLTRAPVDPPT